jgi:hypothetical protein
MEHSPKSSIEKSIQNLNLPEDTFVFIEESQQFGFFERPSQQGYSKIKNIGVVKNTEIRQPTEDELSFYADEYQINKNTAEYINLIENRERWNKANENSPANEINELIDEYQEIEKGIAFVGRHTDIPEAMTESLEKDKQRIKEILEKLTKIKSEFKGRDSFTEETLRTKVPL